MMKALLRKTARKLAGWPILGRLVRIAVALARLPEFRDRLERALALQQPATPGASSGHHLFASEQLPTLLQALSDVNHRQLAEANGQANLARSVPVALRSMMREIVDLRAKNGELRERLDGHIDAALAQIAQVEAKLGQQPLAQLHQTQQDNQNHLQQLSQSVAYLLGRVEFVRRELMFEMRYGASAPGQASEQLKAQVEILAKDKVAQARQDGARVNLGCGHVPLDGYLNVDRRALPGVDIVAEVDELPFAKGELAEICSAHLLEHFPLEQLRRELLPYWVSLLRAGGSFRAIVPDGANMARAFVSEEYSFDNLRQITFGGQDYDGDFHYNMFSVDSLSQLLRDAGFSKVEVVAENRENGGCKEFELVASL
jgi:predicted SAM-dependent methyltransferase